MKSLGVLGANAHGVSGVSCVDDSRSAVSHATPESIVILGSTGSIGTNALAVAKRFGVGIEALTAGSNAQALNAQIAEFRPKIVAVADEVAAQKVETLGARLFVGERGICEMLESCSAPLVLNAIVGFAGLLPSLTATRLNKILALANKESLVAGGWLFEKNSALVTSGVEGNPNRFQTHPQIRPIDSEHFALWSLLKGVKSSAVKKLFITASGGAFRDAPLESIATAGPSDALRHPNWKMGKKITIDSASMANKLFEVLEARWLFGGRAKIDALIERNSLIHAAVELKDGSFFFHAAPADMKLPIAHAIAPALANEVSFLPPAPLESLAAMRFEKIDSSRYPLWALKDTLLENPALGVVLNAANEVAVEAFLCGYIPFGNIAKTCFYALNHFHNTHTAELSTYESIKALDTAVRQMVTSRLESK